MRSPTGSHCNSHLQARDFNDQGICPKISELSATGGNWINILDLQHLVFSV